MENLSAEQKRDIQYSLNILRSNQRTHGDKKLDAQSVRAYNLLNDILKNFLIKDM